MRVLVTGASGWVGSAVVPELLGAGHQVVGLARSDAAAATVAAAGAEVLRGSLEDLDTLRAGATAADGVIHLAFHHDFSQFEAAAALEGRAIRALGEALAGTGRPFVIASGTPIRDGRPSTEEDGFDGFGPAAARGANARATLDLAGRGVRSSIVRLPRSVHGAGDRHGLVPRLIGIDRERGISAYVGDGANRWPAVHNRDAARLFRLALEQAPAGSVLHAVGDEGVPIREVAAIVSERLELPMTSVEAESLGFLGAVLAADQPSSSARTQELLGWHPTEAGLLDDLKAGYYFS